MNKWALIAVPAVMAVLLAGCGGAGNETVKSSTEVDDFQGNCLTDPGFSNISSGTQAVVKKSSGSVIGTGTLALNSSQSAEQSALQTGLSVCIYNFKVTVPDGLPRYGVTVSHRGTVWFSSKQMSRGPDLTVGSGGSGF